MNRTTLAGLLIGLVLGSGTAEAGKAHEHGALKLDVAIDVQVAGPKGQSKATLRRPARSIKRGR